MDDERPIPSWHIWQGIGGDRWVEISGIVTEIVSYSSEAWPPKHRIRLRLRPAMDGAFRLNQHIRILFKDCTLDGKPVEVRIEGYVMRITPDSVELRLMPDQLAAYGQSQIWLDYDGQGWIDLPPHAFQVEAIANG